MKGLDVEPGVDVQQSRPLAHPVRCRALRDWAKVARNHLSSTTSVVGVLVADADGTELAGLVLDAFHVDGNWSTVGGHGVEEGSVAK